MHKYSKYVDLMFSISVPSVLQNDVLTVVVDFINSVSHVEFFSELYMLALGDTQ